MENNNIISLFFPTLSLSITWEVVCILKISSFTLLNLSTTPSLFLYFLYVFIFFHPKSSVFFLQFTLMFLQWWNPPLCKPFCPFFFFYIIHFLDFSSINSIKFLSKKNMITNTPWSIASKRFIECIKPKLLFFPPWFSSSKFTVLNPISLSISDSNEINCSVHM